MLLEGARQVGKTWILKEFAKREYESFVYLNFDEESDLKSIFQSTKNPYRIVDLINMVKDCHIEKGKTLIIFDEIQECPEALNSLKYFKKEGSDYHVAAAGSLLGIFLTETSFPVGMVNILKMYPLDFSEFLLETEPGLYEYFDTIKKEDRIIETFHSRLIECYNRYLIIGGLPECVASYSAEKNYEKINKLQGDLLDLYQRDIAKHNKNVDAARILMILKSLPSQLGKINEKFMFSFVAKGARAREFDDAITWLERAGLIYRVHDVSGVKYPLSAYEKMNAFKLFFFDTGLLKYMAEIDNNSIMLKINFNFKGPLRENYVLQQIIDKVSAMPRYYTKGSMEIDFLIQHKEEIIPVEVKAGEDKSAPSFKRFIDENDSEMAIKFSKRGYLKNGKITNIPLYLASRIVDLL